MDETAKNNPVAESEKQGIRPGFLGGSGGGEAPSGLNPGGQASEKAEAGSGGAADDLRLAEEAASGGLYHPGEGLDGANDAEKSASGLYTGGVGSAAKGILRRGWLKGGLKKGGPVAGVIFSILGMGWMLGSSQFFQPFSLVAQFMESFNSMHTSVNVRSNRFFRAQMETGRTKNPIRGNKIFGETFKISDKQNAELKKQGIEFVEDFEESGLKVLKYNDGEGNVRIVAADDKTVKKLNEMDLAQFSTDEIKVNAEAIDFKKLYASDTKFFNAYNAGSMTWRGQIANWFGTNTSNFLKNNRLTRNMFEHFKEKKEQAGGDGMKVVKETIGERTKTVNVGGVRVADEETETTGGEGNGQTSGDDELSMSEGGGGSINPSEMSESDVKTKLSDISGKFSGAANVGCAVANTIGAINLMVAASEALQIINLTTAYFEAVDKTKAEFGDNSPIHELSIAMNEEQESTNMYIEEVADNGSGVAADENGINGLGIGKKTTKKSAMEAAGIAALYDGGLVDPRDPSVQSFNLTSSTEGIMKKFGQSMEVFRDCTIAKTAVSAISIVTQGIEIGGCVVGVIGAIFTLGASAAGGCAPLVTHLAIEFAAGVAIEAALSGLVSLITPMVTNMLTRDLVSQLGGEDLGNALTSGGNMYQGGAHRASGGSLGSINKYEQFSMSRQQVIAENARYERSTLSPFDISSKNTFMGSVMNQLMSFTHANSVMSTITTSGTVIGSSLASLSPTVSAYDIAESLPTMEEYEETCPYLASIGAIGDSYCNPYVMTDLGTIEDDPADIIDKVYDLGGLEEQDASDGNVVVKKKSELAKYILYCDNRNSAFGIPDYNIASELSSSDGGVKSLITSAGDTTIGGNIPIFGDVAEIVKDEEQLANVGYISGESCVAGNNVNANESPDWNDAQYYQRFIEDQSLAESMGIIDKSAVTAFLDDYYNENPLDNSYEGILARYSGLPKEDIVSLLEIFDYYNYLANYDPSERYAFGSDEVEVMEGTLRFDNEYVMMATLPALENIVYADLRTMNYVA